MNKDLVRKLNEYCEVISDAIAETQESGEITIESEEEFRLFIHALANVVPAAICNNQIEAEEDKMDLLDFNYLANRLCFNYGDRDMGEE